MATIIRISYPEKSNRVQSRSCHVSHIKLDIVAFNLKSMESLYPCFSQDNGEIGLNSYLKPLSFALPNTIIFWTWMLHVLYAKHFWFTHFIKINLLVSLLLIELHKVHFMIMQMTWMLSSLFVKWPGWGLLLCLYHDKKGE